MIPEWLYSKKLPSKRQNLRQKVKQAKKQLAILKDTPTHTQWDMVMNFQAQSKLRDIIDFKRKLSRYYHWNEEHEMNWNALTYIAIYADSEKLAELKSTNGKPLKYSVVNDFVDLIIKTKLYNYAAKVSKLEKHPINEKINDWRYQQRIDTMTYSFKVSNDRTKQKRFHCEPFYYQMRGEDTLYKPNREKSVESEVSS